METYSIIDYRRFKPSFIAVLTNGLKNDSRIKMKISGQNMTFSETLLSAIFDKLSVFCWLFTEDGRRNINRPESILKILSGNDKTESFTIEEFKKQRQKILRRS